MKTMCPSVRFAHSAYHGSLMNNYIYIYIYIYIYTYMSVYIFICVYSKCPIVLKHCTTNFYSKRFKQLKDFGDPTEAKVCHVKYTGIYKFSVTIMNRFIE